MYKSVLVFTLALALTTACDKKRETVDSAAKPVEKKIDDEAASRPVVKIEVDREAFEAKRDLFTKAMEQQAQVLDAKMDVLKSKVDTLSGEAKEVAKRQLEVLVEKRAELGKKLRQAKDATAMSWDRFESAVKSAADELGQSLDETLERVKR